MTNKQPFPFADLNKVIALMALTLVIGLVTNAWALSLPFTKTVETTSGVASLTPPLTEDWQTYQDNNLNIAFEYPTQWSVTKGTIIYGKNTGETIGIKKPTLTTTAYPQDPSPSIYIEIFNVPSDSTDILQTYTMIKDFSPDLAQSIHLKSQANVSGASTLEYCGIPGLFSYCETMFLKEGALYIIGMVEGMVAEDLYNHVVSSFKFIDGSISDWETYSNNELGFNFKYPTDWKIEEVNGYGLFVEGNQLKPKLSGVSASAESWRNDIPEGGRSFLILYTDISAQEFINRYNNEEDETSSISNQIKETMAGKPATHITAATSIGLANEIIIFDQESHEPILIEYNDFDPIHKQILSTFKFTDEMADWQTYTNNEYGFTFNYPMNWSIAETHADPEIPINSDTVVVSELSFENSNFNSLRVCPKDGCIPYQDGLWNSTSHDIIVSDLPATATEYTYNHTAPCPTCTPRMIISLKRAPSSWAEDNNFLLIPDNSGSYAKIEDILSTFRFTK